MVFCILFDFILLIISARRGFIVQTSLWRSKQHSRENNIILPYILFDNKVNSIRNVANNYRAAVQIFSIMTLR